MTIELAYGWRTRVRIVVAAVVTFMAGVVAATAGAHAAVRVVAAAVFLAGAVAVLDATVLTASWRMTASALKIPTLVQRQREIVGREDLSVTFRGRWFGAVVVAGASGARTLRVNPLVAGHDLRRWFDAMADDATGRG